MSENALFIMLLCFCGLSSVVAHGCRPAWRAPCMAACGLVFLALASLPSALTLGAYAAVFVLLLKVPGSRHVGIPLALAVVVAHYLVHLSAAMDPNATAGRWVLPLGLAFYVLRLIHYGVELRAGTLAPHSAREFLAWIFFCPVLPVGPIYRFEGFLKDFRRLRWDPQQFSQGCEALLLGCVKFFIVGNWLYGKYLLPLLVEWNQQGGVPGLYATSLRLWIPLYVYFSAFSSVAQGAGALCGLVVPANFRAPFLSRSVVEFWTRWHISLGQWCRHYVFMPVMARTRHFGLSIAASMVVLGLWHEWSLRYLLWGAYHAAGILVVQRLTRRHARSAPSTSLGTPLGTLWSLGATLLTVHFVLFSFAATTSIDGWIRSFATHLIRHVSLSR